MGDTRYCLQCGKIIGMWDKVCKYCGTHQFGKNDEFYPTEEQVQTLARMIEQSNRNETVFPTFSKREKRRKEPVFTDEEILALGLYPDDEGYKMSLIARILGK